MVQAAEPTDEELVVRARAGDERAFRQIVSRYEDRVAATVIGMVGRGATAEDVAQETFIRFYRAIDSFRGEAALGTYLTRIAINQALKALRKKRRWTDRFRSLETDSLDAVESGDDVGVSIDERNRSRHIEVALRTLSPEHRAVVVLRLLEEYSTKETAAMLGIPEGTVMSRLSRALQKLGPRLEALRPA